MLKNTHLVDFKVVEKFLSALWENKDENIPPLGIFNMAFARKASHGLGIPFKVIVTNHLKTGKNIDVLKGMHLN